MENLRNNVEKGKENLWFQLDNTYRDMVEMVLGEENNSVEEQVSTVAKLLKSYSFARSAFDKNCEEEDLESLLSGLELEQDLESQIFEKYKQDKQKQENI